MHSHLVLTKMEGCDGDKLNVFSPRILPAATCLVSSAAVLRSNGNAHAVEFENNFVAE